jgi:hypothetical protein
MRWDYRGEGGRGGGGWGGGGASDMRSSYATHLADGQGEGQGHCVADLRRRRRRRRRGRCRRRLVGRVRRRRRRRRGRCRRRPVGRVRRRRRAGVSCGEPRGRCVTAQPRRQGNLGGGGGAAAWGPAPTTRGGVGPRTHHAECAAGRTFRVAIRSGALPFGGPGARRSAPPPAAAPSGIGLDLSCLQRFDIGLQAEMT